MNLIKLEINHKVNDSSSWIVYLAKTKEDADALHKIAMTQKAIVTGDNYWYYTVSTVEVKNDCRIPTFFHDRGYYATVIEHNNGDWGLTPKYDLYIVE